MNAAALPLEEMMEERFGRVVKCSMGHSYNEEWAGTQCSICDGIIGEQAMTDTPQPAIPGFFYDKCEKHRAQPAPELLWEDEQIEVGESYAGMRQLYDLLATRLREARTLEIDLRGMVAEWRQATHNAKAENAKLRAELEQANNYKGEYWETSE